MVKFLSVILWLVFFPFQINNISSTHRQNEHIQTHNEAVGARFNEVECYRHQKRYQPIFYLPCGRANVEQLRLFLKRDHVRRSHIKSQISIYTIIWANPFPRFILFFISVSCFLSRPRSLFLAFTLTLARTQLVRNEDDVVFISQPRATGDAALCER